MFDPNAQKKDLKNKIDDTVNLHQKRLEKVVDFTCSKNEQLFPLSSLCDIGRKTNCSTVCCTVLLFLFPLFLLFQMFAFDDKLLIVRQQEGGNRQGDNHAKHAHQRAPDGE